MMGLRRSGVIGECDARTQGVFISGIWARPRTRQRAAERGRAAQASLCESLSDLLGLGALHALVPEAHADEEECAERDDDRGAEHAVTAERVGGRLAEEVGEQPEASRPDDAARRVPEEEAPPRHVRDAGEPGRRDAEHGDEAADEDGLAAVLAEEALAGRQGALRVAPNRPPAVEEPSPACAADQVAD